MLLIYTNVQFYLSEMRNFTIKKTCYNILSLTYLILVTFILFSCSDTGNNIITGSLLIGIAEVNYTPRIGLDLVGNYRGDDYASRGVHDSLYSRAIVAADQYEIGRAHV